MQKNEKSLDLGNNTKLSLLYLEQMENDMASMITDENDKFDLKVEADLQLFKKVILNFGVPPKGTEVYLSNDSLGVVNTITYLVDEDNSEGICLDIELIVS